MGVVTSLVAGTIGTAALLAGGATAATMAATGSTKEKLDYLGKGPQAPTPKTAEEKAKDELLKKRRMQERTGGKTILTSQYGSAVNSTKKSLLGE